MNEYEVTVTIAVMADDEADAERQVVSVLEENLAWMSIDVAPT